jgi:hypothetical protein
MVKRAEPVVVPPVPPPPPPTPPPPPYPPEYPPPHPPSPLSLQIAPFQTPDSAPPALPNPKPEVVASGLEVDCVALEAVWEDLERRSSAEAGGIDELAVVEVGEKRAEAGLERDFDCNRNRA